MNKDVHTEHCCVAHGCKYSDPKCSVVSQEKEQSYPCEQCMEDTEDEAYIRKLEMRLEEIKNAAEAYEKDPINISDRPESWMKLSNLVRLAKQ